MTEASNISEELVKPAPSAKVIAARVVAFVLLGIALVAALSLLLAPIVSGNTNDDTVKGIYDQPKNTVQIVVFGPSTAHAGISSMDLYEDHGFSTYNCATSLQSFEMTYWLMEEMVRLHGNELKLALIDPSIVILGASKAKRQGQSERALISMAYSPVRIQASIDMWKLYKNAGFVESLIPVVRYHSRWDELTEADFALPGVGERSNFTHGQFIRYLSNSEHGGKAPSSKANATITEEIESSEDELKANWNENDIRYLEKFKALCDERGIDIVFFQTPRIDWGDEQHDGIQLLADTYDIPFLDLSTEQVMDELGISYETDYVDKKHPNLHGARKITKYIGEFLAQNYDLEDKRGQAAFSFLEDDSARYDMAVEDSELLLVDTVEEYVSRLNCDHYTVFVSTRGDAAKALSDEARAGLAELGLTNLAALEDERGYVGIVDGGAVAVDEPAEKAGKSVEASGVYHNGTLTMRETKMQAGASLKNAFSVKSSSKAAAITLNGKQRAENGVGINFVVVNKLTNEVIDTSCFDTASGSKRTSDLP